MVLHFRHNKISSASGKGSAMKLIHCVKLESLPTSHSAPASSSFCFCSNKDILLHVLLCSFLCCTFITSSKASFISWSNSPGYHFSQFYLLLDKEVNGVEGGQQGEFEKEKHKCKTRTKTYFGRYYSSADSKSSQPYFFFLAFSVDAFPANSLVTPFWKLTLSLLVRERSGVLEGFLSSW